MSFAVILIPGSGVTEAYAGHLKEYNDALGVYLSIWFLVTVLFWFVSRFSLFFPGRLDAETIVHRV